MTALDRVDMREAAGAWDAHDAFAPPPAPADRPASPAGESFGTGAMTFTTYAQNFEDLLLWRALKDQPEGFYIDVGAWDPDRDSVTRAFSERGWRGINIEPVTQWFERLTVRRPRDVNLQVAIGAKAGVVDLHEVVETGLSTLVAAHADKHAVAGFAVAYRTVDMITLAEVCRRHAPATIHFLKIDCEGSERSVLLGADFASYRPWIVVVEATEPNSTRPVHEAWEGILLDADYRFAWFDGLNRFYVAAEHAERLVPLIALPPNVFDRFVYPPAEPVALPPRPLDPLVAATPPMLDLEQRIALAGRCRDCDDVPKVVDAGRVVVEPDGTRVQIMHNGLKVLADGYCGEWMTRLIALCRGHHEPQEERVFDRLVRALPADATMLELGSNWAYYSAWFLQGMPRRRAVLLEPDPANRAVGERNLALNGLAATVRAGFAGRRPVPPAPFETERSGVHLLPCCTVPQLLDEEGIDLLDLLHCDAQGAEYDVLRGSRALFEAGRVRWVVVSTHVHQISRDPLTHQRCLALLRAAGAVIEAEHNAYESYTGDGLIVARFGPAPPGWRPVVVSHARQGETLFREPVYDLVDAADAALDERMRGVVEDVFRATLMRSVEPPAAADLGRAIVATGSALPFLRDVFHSAEFAAKRPRFEAEYFADTRALVPGGAAGSDALRCRQVDLVLAADGPLGRAGEALVAPNDRVMLPMLLRDGGWNVEHLALLRDRLDPARPHLLLDVGANIGLFTRQVLNAFPIAECHCIEPDPENFAALTRNLAGKRYGKARLHKLALGPADGQVPFFRDEENSGNYSCNPDAMRGRPHQVAKVRMRETGRWLDEHIGQGDLPILWKSDTQGSDEAIVAATPWPIWRRVAVALVELWRIRKDGDVPPGFLERVADMPHRRLGARDVSVADVAAYLSSEDWAHEDLLLWRDPAER